MDAQQQRLEIEPGSARDDDLAVDDAALRQRGGQRDDELRKVAVHWLLVAALQQDVVAVAKDQRSKAVPLGLELPPLAAGQGVRGAGQHGRERRSEGKPHARPPLSLVQRPARGYAPACEQPAGGCAVASLPQSYSSSPSSRRSSMS